MSDTQPADEKPAVSPPVSGMLTVGEIAEAARRRLSGAGDPVDEYAVRGLIVSTFSNTPPERLKMWVTYEDHPTRATEITKVREILKRCSYEQLVHLAVGTAGAGVAVAARAALTLYCGDQGSLAAELADGYEGSGEDLHRAVEAILDGPSAHRDDREV